MAGMRKKMRLLELATFTNLHCLVYRYCNKLLKSMVWQDMMYPNIFKTDKPLLYLLNIFIIFIRYIYYI